MWIWSRTRRIRHIKTLPRIGHSWNYDIILYIDETIKSYTKQLSCFSKLENKLWFSIKIKIKIIDKKTINITHIRNVGVWCLSLIGGRSHSYGYRWLSAICHGLWHSTCVNRIWCRNALNRIIWNGDNSWNKTKN